ncbi:hypothetical protein OSTOST_19815, partial [Ostertagia ostertagi]
MPAVFRVHRFGAPTEVDADDILADVECEYVDGNWAIRNKRGEMRTVDPLAVLLDRGCRRSFWINCLLTLLGFIPGVIHALAFPRLALGIQRHVLEPTMGGQRGDTWLSHP